MGRIIPYIITNQMTDHWGSPAMAAASVASPPPPLHGVLARPWEIQEGKRGEP